MMRLSNPRSRVLAGVATAVIAAGAASGCGDDDEAATGGSAPVAENAEFTGAPVKVFVSAPLKTQIADVPEVPAGAKAAARAINARGGLDGRKVEIEVCNDTDPNAEVACARKAVKEGALAFAGSVFLLNPGAAEGVLAKARIPSVATFALQTVQLSNPVNFPIDAPGLGFLPCPTAVPAVSAKKRVTTIAQNLPNQLESVKLIARAARTTGADYGGEVVVPVTQTDLSSAVQRLSGKGAEIVTTQLAPTALPALVTAATALGKKFSYCSSASNVPLQLLTKLGDAEFYAGSAFPPLTAADKYPLVAEFKEDMEAEREAGTEGTDLTTGLPFNAMRSWLALRIIEQVAGDVEGELDNETLLAALGKAKVDLDGVVPPMDFSKPVTAKGFERFFNPQMRLVKWDQSKKDWVETEAEPQNTLELLDGGGAKR